MASESTGKTARRKPTKREAARTADHNEEYYSKLTRLSTPGSTTHRVSSAQEVFEQGREEVTRRMEALSSEDATPGDDRATGFETLSYGSRKRVYGTARGRRAIVTTDSRIAVFLGIALIGLFFVGGFFIWSHRPVTVMVNGSKVTVHLKSTLDDVYAHARIETVPGNLVSVGGNLVEEGAGYPFTASVDDVALSREEMDAYRVRGGESIGMGDGTDRTEDYDVSYNEFWPKLTFVGEGGAVCYVRQWGTVGRQEIHTGRRSGEMVEAGWTSEPRDCVVDVRNIVPADGERLVALTFDDGPDATYTEAILQLLEERGAKATFFVTGEAASANASLAKRIAATGNQLCSRGNSGVELTSLGAEDLVSELQGAHDAIYAAAGVDTTLLRPVNGAFSPESWLASGGTVSATVLSNQDGLDETQSDPVAILEHALSGVQSGSIIALHDGGGDRSQTVAALPGIIESLQAGGYRLVTLSELLASDPEIPTDIATGYAHMPADCAWPTEFLGAEMTADLTTE